MQENGDKVAWIRTNRGVAACVTALCVVLLAYMLGQDWVYDEQRDGFLLGFFPVVGAVAILICGLAMTVDRLSHDTTPEMATIRLRHVANSLLALATMGVYFVLAWDAHFAQDWLRVLLDVIPMTGEFILWTPIFLAIGMYFLGVRPVGSALIAGVIVGLVIFGLFLLIGITLPSNFLES